VFQPTLVKVYIITALVVEAIQSVSVGDVVTNATAALNPSKMYHFYTNAFIETETIVQLTILVSGLLLLWIVRDLGSRKTFQHTRIEA
jgi:hypothetical protein